jgi:predicted DNA-binding antitoxin AbrB/MazE fold protein
MQVMPSGLEDPPGWKPDKELTIPAGEYVIIKKRVLADLLESCRQCASERNECLDKLRTK